MVGLGGVTAIVLSVASVTVSFAVPFVPEFESVAVIVTAPTLSALAFPSLPIVAIVASLVVHATSVVMSLFVPSEKTPIALNACCVPAGVDAVGGVT
jgi:hypothetical protein